MSTNISGSAEILKIYDVDAYKPLVCLISNGLSESVNSVESITKCDAGQTKRKAGSYSYEISFEGEYVETEAGKISWAELRTKLRSLGTFTWNIETTYADDSTHNEYGTGFFSALEKTSGTKDENITFSGTLMGSGLITATDPNA